MRLPRALCAFALTFLLLTHGSALPPAFAEELSVSAHVDKTEVALGEKFVFTVTLGGWEKESPKVQLPGFDGFEVLSSGQSQQVQVREGKIQQSVTLSYVLVPRSEGTHTLESVKVEYHGKEYATSPIQLKVVSRPAAPDRPPRLEGGVIL